VVLPNAYKCSILMISNATELAGIATSWAWVADMEPVGKLKISASVWNLTVTSRSSTLKPSHSADPRQLKPTSQRNTISPSPGSSLQKESTTRKTSLHPSTPSILENLIITRLVKKLKVHYHFQNSVFWKLNRTGWIQSTTSYTVSARFSCSCNA
jgi:hypothetical protein